MSKQKQATQFGVIVAPRPHQAVRKISTGKASAIGVNHVQKMTIFASKSLNVKEVNKTNSNVSAESFINSSKLISFCLHSNLAMVTVTRDCLSTLNSGYRTDLPADRYEGCRPASHDVRLGHYVFNNTIKELDIRRDYYDSTTFCYCFLDHRCNSSTSITSSIWSCGIGLAIALLAAFKTL